MLAELTKIAVIGLGASQASKDCVALTADTFRLWGPDLGMEVVYTNDTLPFGLPNGVAPEVTAMDEAGVDYIHTCMDQNGVLTLEQEQRNAKVSRRSPWYSRRATPTPSGWPTTPTCSKVTSSDRSSSGPSKPTSTARSSTR